MQLEPTVIEKIHLRVLFVCTIRTDSILRRFAFVYLSGAQLELTVICPLYVEDAGGRLAAIHEDRHGPRSATPRRATARRYDSFCVRFALSLAQNLTGESTEIQLETRSNMESVLKETLSVRLTVGPGTAFSILSEIRPSSVGTRSDRDTF